MKRILFTIIATITVFAGSKAQSFEFRLNDQPLDDGATVEFIAEQDLVTGYTCDTEGLDLCNLSGARLDYHVDFSRVSGSLGAGVTLQICLGNLCRTDFPVSYDDFAFVGAAQPTNIHVYNCQEGEMLTKLTVSSGGESRTVLIRFVHDEELAAGINGVVQLASRCKVYDLAGNCIIPLADMADVAGRLRPGVYVVAPCGGTAVRKLVVR